MEIKISQVVSKMPENKILPEYDSDYRGTGNSDDDYDYGFNRGDICGYNQALSEVSSLPLDNKKVIDLVEFKREEMAIIIYEKYTGSKLNGCEPYKPVMDWSNALSDALIESKSDILTIKGDV